MYSIETFRKDVIEIISKYTDGLMWNIWMIVAVIVGYGIGSKFYPLLEEDEVTMIINQIMSNNINEVLTLGNGGRVIMIYATMSIVIIIFVAVMTIANITGMIVGTGHKVEENTGKKYLGIIAISILLLIWNVLVCIICGYDVILFGSALVFECLTLIVRSKAVNKIINRHSKSIKNKLSRTQSE